MRAISRFRSSGPAYRRYRPKNLAVVRINGRDIYLGPYGSPESLEKYHRLVAEALATESSTTSQQTGRERDPITVSELVNAFRKFAEGYYVKNGRATKELADMKYAARPLRKLYGSTLAKDFGPLALKAVREHMITHEKLSRGVINHRVNRIRRIFKWGVSEELIPGAVLESLKSVDGLRFGRTAARETEPVRPVPMSHVEAVLPYLSRPVAAMVQLQSLTGMRPCEVVQMRAADIDQTGEVWVYEPSDHKNRWRGHRRLIPLGPKAQGIVKEFLDQSPDAYLFCPKDAEVARNAAKRASRKTPMTPSHLRRGPKKNRKRAPRLRYDTDSYRRAITYGIMKANKNCDQGSKIPAWNPLQLRHSRATEIRKQFGLEAAQASLGHARADVTQVYAERNFELAIQVARTTG